MKDTNSPSFDSIHVSFAVGQISGNLCWHFDGPNGGDLFQTKGKYAGMVLLTKGANIRCRVTVFPDTSASRGALSYNVSILDCQLFAVPRQQSTTVSPFAPTQDGSPVYRSFLPASATVGGSQPQIFESGDFFPVTADHGNWDLSMILTASLTPSGTSAGGPTAEAVIVRCRFDPEGVVGTPD